MEDRSLQMIAMSRREAKLSVVAKSDRRLVGAASLDSTGRSRRDTARFCSLTPYGEHYLIILKEIPSDVAVLSQGMRARSDQDVRLFRDPIHGRPAYTLNRCRGRASTSNHDRYRFPYGGSVPHSKDWVHGL
jgi:hypothetical protein